MLRGTVKDHTWADRRVRHRGLVLPGEEGSEPLARVSRRGGGRLRRLRRGTGRPPQTGSGASGATGFAGPDQQGSSTSESLDEVLAELDSLPGLESVAGQVRTLANRVRLDKERERRGMAVTEREMHAVFIGPPGTGKTTVARIWGRVLAATGPPPSGHVIETDRSGLVGQHVGEAAQKTTEVIDRAKGRSPVRRRGVQPHPRRSGEQRLRFRGRSTCSSNGWRTSGIRSASSSRAIRGRWSDSWRATPAWRFPLRADNDVPDELDAAALVRIFTRMAAKDDVRGPGLVQQRLFAALAQLADAWPMGGQMPAVKRLHTDLICTRSTSNS